MQKQNTSRRSVVAKIATCARLNLSVFVLCGLIAAVCFYMFSLRHSQLHELDEQIVAVERLERFLSNASKGLLEILLLDQTELAPALLALAEDFRTVFAQFKDIAVQNRIIGDLSFVEETEPHILSMRDNIVRCIALYRQGRRDEAIHMFNTSISKQIRHIQEFGERSHNAKHLQIEAVQERLERDQLWAASLILFLFGSLILVSLRCIASCGKPFCHRLPACREPPRNSNRGTWSIPLRSCPRTSSATWPRPLIRWLARSIRSTSK